MIGNILTVKVCLLANIATRTGAKPSDIGNNSRLINCEDWITLPAKEPPTKTVRQINLNSNDMQQMKKEVPFDFNLQDPLCSKSSTFRHGLPAEVQKFYSYSQYLID